MWWFGGLFRVTIFDLIDEKSGLILLLIRFACHRPRNWYNCFYSKLVLFGSNKTTEFNHITIALYLIPRNQSRHCACVCVCDMFIGASSFTHSLIKLHAHWLAIIVLKFCLEFCLRLYLIHRNFYTIVFGYCVVHFLLYFDMLSICIQQINDTVGGYIAFSFPVFNRWSNF